MIVNTQKERPWTYKMNNHECVTKWITVKHASKLAKKSESTIRRMVKKKNVVSKKSESGQCLVDHNSLSALFILNNQTDHMNDQEYRHVNQVHNLIDQVNNQIDNSNLVKTLREQVAEKDKQMTELHQRIKEMNERIRELHVLLKQSHNENQNQLPLMNSQPTGVFSKILVKFGL